MPPTLLACLADNKLRLTAAARACRMRELLLAGTQPGSCEQAPLPLSGVAGGGNIFCSSATFSSCGAFLATVCVTAVPGPEFMAAHAVAVYSVDKEFEQVGVLHTDCSADIRWAPTAPSLSVHQLPNWHCHTETAEWPNSGCPPVFVMDVAQWRITHRLGADMLADLLSLAPYPRRKNKVTCDHIMWCPAGRYLLAHGLWARDFWAQDDGVSQSAANNRKAGRGVQEQEIRLMIVDVRSDALVGCSKLQMIRQGSIEGVHSFHPAVWHPLQSLVVLSGNVKLSDSRAFAQAGFSVASLPAHCSLSGINPPDATISCVLPHTDPSIFSLDAAFVSATMGRYPYGRRACLGHCVCALSSDPSPTYSVVHTIEDHQHRMHPIWVSRSVLLVCGPSDMSMGLDICTGAELYQSKLKLLGNHVRLPAWPNFGKADGYCGSASHSLWSAESGQQIWQDQTIDESTNFDHLVWSPTGCGYAYTTCLGKQQRPGGAIVKYFRFM